MIHSKAKEAHFSHIRIVLKLLTEHELNIKLKKSFFAVPEIMLLSHIVDKNGVRTDPEKIERIQKRLSTDNEKGTSVVRWTCIQLSKNHQKIRKNSTDII